MDRSERRSQRRALRAIARWTKRVVLGTLALAVLAVAALIGAAHTDWGRNWARERLVAYLQTDFPGTTIEAIDGSVFGTVVIRGLTLNGRDGRPLVTIERVAVQPAPLQLIYNTVWVDSIRVSGATVYVREQPPAEPAPAAPASAPSDSPTLSIELPDIAIDNARVVIDGEAGREIVDELALRAAIRIPAGEPIAAAARLHATWRGKPLTALASVTHEHGTTAVPIAAVTLGDARLAAFAVRITERPAIAGMLAATVPAALVRELAEHDVPGDIALTAGVRETGDIAVHAALGAARVDANAVADLAALRAHAVVAATTSDLASLTRGELAGAGTVVAAFAADPERVRGVVSTTSTVDGAPPATALVAIDATLARVELVAAGRAGRMRGVAESANAAATASLESRGAAWHLADATLFAHARDAGGVRGTVEVSLAARGPLSPAPELAVTGSIDARQLRRDDLRIGRAHVSVNALAGRDRQSATIAATLGDVRSGDTRIPAASLDARATASSDGVIALALGHHRARTADGAVWTGRGGRVSVTGDRIAIDAVRTGTGNSRITASAHIARTSTDLDARIRAREVALAIADPSLHGDVDADLQISRTGGRWRGGGIVHARGVGTTGQPAVDGTVELKLAGRRVTLAGDATYRSGIAELGRTRVALAVTGPRDITDVLAWKRLPRAALDHASITLAGIDARPLGGTGTLDGQLELSASDATGELHVRDVVTAAGPVDADVVVTSGDAGTLRTQLTAQLPGVPPVTADATVAVPAHPFDPAAWQALGRRALRAATVHVPEVAIDPALLARFGIDAPYQARVAVTAAIDEGARAGTLTADVRGLRGGKLDAPIDVHVSAATSATGTSTKLTARWGNVAIELGANTPLTVDGALAGGVPTAPIEATLKLPAIPARDLLRLVGETEVLSGEVGGTVTISGTVAAPTVRAQLAAQNIAMASSLTGRKPPTLDSLDVDARWAAGQVDLEVRGRQAGGRLLDLSARGRPDRPGSIRASIQAANFDLAPLAAFAPGQLGAARGTLQAALDIRGLDPQTGDVRGMLRIQDGRLPLSPTLGTLRRAAIDVTVVKQTIVAKLDARLGAGNGGINGTLTAKLEGGMPVEAKLDAQLRKVTPIGELQPQISADVTGSFVNEGPRWAGQLVVKNGKVFVPPEGGNELLGAGAPSDLIFIDTMKVVNKGRRPPAKPWLVTRVAIGKTDIDVEDTDVRVRVVARGKLQIEVGDGVGIVGTITTERGSVDVLGRRYRLESGVIDFDGMPDPRLDIRMVHDFKNLSLTVDVRGRASDPDLRLSGDPGTYTQGQLLSFLAGAEPGGDDSNSQANQAVVSGGMTFLSSRVGRRINKYMPVKFDTINYEAGTASSSRAVRFGFRLSERSYLLWRQRLEARPDENPGEIVFEYQLRKNALFETTVGERATGADLLLRTRW